ncbi:unnamed protein product, partial [Discosporangium mesarthrocarpum]
THRERAREGERGTMASFTRRKGQARQKQAGGRTESENVKVSKRLTYALRHGSENLNLQLRPDGFVPLEDLLRLPMFRGVCREDIEQIVGNDPKGRLSLCKEGDVELIRANQGHSVQGLVDPEKLLTRVVDASEVPVCVHGTFKQYWDSILSGGLSRMGRTHIHFATGLPEESGVISGMRSSCQLLIYVDIGAAMRDGIVFYRSSNNVILTGTSFLSVPPFSTSWKKAGSLSTDYFSRVVDVTVQGGRIIFPHHKTENAEELQAKPSSSQQHPGAPLGRVNGCARGSGAVSFFGLCEIIEFPTVLVDSRTLEVVAEFREYVRPVRHPRLDPFCTQLTGIEQVHARILLCHAISQRTVPVSFGLSTVGTNSVLSSMHVIGSWNLKTMLPAQCSLIAREVPPHLSTWVNLKRVYQVQLGSPEAEEAISRRTAIDVDMAGMLQAEGLRLEGRHHSGLDDCRNIAKILINLCR